MALRRGSDTLDGGRLTIDLNSGVSNVEGGKGGAAPGSTSTASWRPGQRQFLGSGSAELDGSVICEADRGGRRFTRR